MIAQANAVQQIGATAIQQMPYTVSIGHLHDEEKIKEVAKEFESLFIEQLLKQADRTLEHEDNILYAGHAEDVFRGMYNQQLARMMAQAGGFGLAEMIEAELAASAGEGNKE